nr:ribonuclease H-like domain-containing protein [Tanacetum cinerariifolium]
MRPFGCHVTILNTIDHLGKFDGKADEGFFVGYFMNSRAFKVFNSRTRIVEENLHIRFSESTPYVVGSGPDWLFDIDALTRTMNYELIIVGTQSNGFAGAKASDNAGQASKETEPIKDYILLPLWTADPPFYQDPKSFDDDGSKSSSDDRKKVDEDPRQESECKDQEKEDNVNNTNNVNVASINEVNVVGGKTNIKLPFDLNMHALEDISTFNFISDHEDDGEMDDMNNLNTIIQDLKIQTFLIEYTWLKKHCMDYIKLLEHEVKTASTPLETQNPMLKDEDGEEVDVHMYRYQVNLKISHLHAMKRIFRYALTVNPTIYISFIEQFWSTAKAKTINGEAQIHAKVDGKKIIVIESSVRRDLRLADEKYEAVHKEFGDRLVRAATTASILEANQDSGNIDKTQSKATPKELSSPGTTSGYGPRCQDTMGHTIAQTRSERVSKLSNDLLLASGNTLQSDEDRMKLNELMELCITLQTRVLDLEKTNTTHALEINSLKNSKII